MEPMMVKKPFVSFMTIFYIVCIIVLIVLGYVGYKKFQEPSEEEIQKYANLNIMTIFDNELITTGIIVEENGQVILNTETMDRGATTLKIFFNDSISVSTFNLENQTFFLQSERLKVDSPEAVQIKFRLVERGEIEVEENVQRKFLILKVRTFEKDFGDLTLFLKSSGVVVQNSGVTFDLTDKKISDAVDFDKGYMISENFKKDELLSIKLPFVKISGSPSIEYCLSGVEENEVVGITKADGYCGKIDL